MDTNERFLRGYSIIAFPLSFRSDMRKKLDRLVQNNKSVSTYVHELEEMFIVIGNVTPRDQVIKIWDGLRDDIQQGLWKNHYNPETSLWDEVVDYAEKLEISENVTSNYTDTGSEGEDFYDDVDGAELGQTREQDQRRTDSKKTSSQSPPVQS